MPKRTNPRQLVIELLEKMNEGPDCTVTPSKIYVLDGLEREVDVVVERVIDRETITWCFEVVARKRHADVEWVEQMIAKHETLPTDRLFLVSWSGFTGGAERRAKDVPRVSLCTVDAITDRGRARIKTIRVGTIQLTPRETRIGFERPDGSKGWVRSEPDFAIYNANMEVVGSSQDLMQLLLGDPRVVPLAREHAAAHPEPQDLKSFDFAAPIEHANLNLLNIDLDESQHITLVEVLGDFQFEEKRLDMEVRMLRGEPFAYGSVKLAEADATLVTRLTEDFEISAGIARFEKPK